MAKRKKDVVKQEEVVEDIDVEIPVELEEEKTSEMEEVKEEKHPEMEEVKEVKEEVHVYFDDEEDDEDD